MIPAKVVFGFGSLGQGKTSNFWYDSRRFPAGQNTTVAGKIMLPTKQFQMARWIRQWTPNHETSLYFLAHGYHSSGTLACQIGLSVILDMSM